MKKAIQNKFLAIIIISTLISSLLFTYIFAEYMEIHTKEDLAYSLTLIDNYLDYNSSIDTQINSAISKNQMRITLIDLEGKVIADTALDSNTMENHSDRAEVKQAINHNSAIMVRHSESMDQNLLYVAKKSKNPNYILRISVPYSGTAVFILALFPTITIGAIISFIISLIFANKFTKTISEPLEEISEKLLKIQLNEECPVYFNRYAYKELNEVCNTAEILSRRIIKNQQRLKEEKNKISYILDNMTEGIILIDKSKAVITINKSALNALESTENQKNKNILSYTNRANIIDGVDKAIDKGISSFFDIESKGRIYSVHITQVQEGILQSTGAIILLIDVTTERKTQKIRQEFFSNASHELKTPLTSIMGYSELLETDMAKYNYKQFVARIRAEAENMASLINDILTISRLEAGITHQEKAVIHTRSMIEDIIKVYEPEILKNNIDVKLNTDNFDLYGVYTSYYQLFNNLIGNAVKYNEENGKIIINCKKEDNSFYFSVKNTGIPIPPQYESRIFERFFRVDKGRSKKIKGTGLGLAIVKHIVDTMQGTVQMKNTEGMIEFSVIAPIENEVGK